MLRLIYGTGFLSRQHRCQLLSLASLHWLEKGLSLYCCPLMGARRHVRSFLPPVPYGGSPPTLHCGQVCHTALLLFGRRRYYLFAVAQGIISNMFICLNKDLKRKSKKYSKLVGWHNSML